MTKSIKKKLIITGHGECGKGEVCKIFRELGYDSISSSEFAAPYVFEKVGKAMGYDNHLEFWEHRRDSPEMRAIWFNKIVEYNTPDLSHLGTNLFKVYDIYDGIRNLDELRALEESNAFDFSIWVDASERVEPESSKSMTVKREHCQKILDNNGPVEDLRERVYDFYLKYLV